MLRTGPVLYTEGALKFDTWCWWAQQLNLSHANIWPVFVESV